jgi:hypothetical protein
VSVPRLYFSARREEIEAGEITILISTLRRLKRAIGCRYEDLLQG